MKYSFWANKITIKLHFAFHENHICLNIKPSSVRKSCPYLYSLMKISKNKYVFYNNHCDSIHFSIKKPREITRNSEKFQIKCLRL